MPKEIDIEAVVLSSGEHSEPNGEFAACVSPVLGAFLRTWNDALDDETRQELKPYAVRVIGTAGDGKDEQRAWMAVDWLARTQLPAWLDLAGLSEHAAAVRALVALSSTDTARDAQPTLFLQSPHPLPIWSAAQSRAPPAVA